MPSTVNGIGTGYWGRGNVQHRRGICRSCGRSATLTSYDTRLCFVVFFLPVIPLRKLRIIDDCSLCRRHWAAKRDEYEMSRQLNVSGAQQRFREQPSPDTALEAHGVLLGFHQHEQAESFRHEVAERFPNSPELAAGLAAHLEHVGRYEDAHAWYDKAWQLNPDLPQARIAIALRKMGEGELDEARDLLDFLEQPGAAQIYSLGPLESLAQCYQQRGRHEEMLKICEHLLAEVPTAAEHYQFRQFVAKSEKALRRTSSILPPRQHGLWSLVNFKSTSYAPRQRWAAFVGVVLTLVLIGMAVNNEFIRQSRTLHVVNAFSRPAQVAIDGGEPVEVADRGHLLLPEGVHHVQIKGPVDEEFDVDLAAGYFDRWLKSPAWVVNVGGAALLAESRMVYAVAPPPSVPRLLAGQRFAHLPHVDYLFTPAPASIKLENHGQQIIKTKLEVLPASPDQLFSALSKSAPEVAMNFAEDQLPRHVDDVFLMRHYLDLAEAKGWQERSAAFLHQGCGRRPVEVNWHRAYQSFLEEQGRQDALIAEYEAALQADPQNGSLLYLRGRVEPDPQRARPLYEQAISADPSLPWPCMALAYRQASMGHWQECLQSIEKARERNVDETQLGLLAQQAELAAGDHRRLEQRYREQIAAAPQDGRPVLMLTDLLAADGKADAARQVLVEWETRAIPLQTPDREKTCAPMREMIQYQIGDFPALEQLVMRFGDDSPEMWYAFLIARGKARQAADDPKLAQLWSDPWSALALCVALGLDGQNDAAAQWRTRVAAALAKRGHDDQRVAELLRATAAPPIDSVMDANTRAIDKALLLAALAQQFPDARGEYLTKIRLLNVSRFPPYHLLAKAAAAEAP